MHLEQFELHENDKVLFVLFEFNELFVEFELFADNVRGTTIEALASVLFTQYGS